ncbi:hypothetical protein [Azospirillum sp. B506]|uniref:hypothetical protein n=1 Tax=Azospirillum sp. B506 TaxID=137721 RepID=UPI0006795D53|nr:hypothetical protein [Azospirillum sp. B506]
MRVFSSTGSYLDHHGAEPAAEHGDQVGDAGQFPDVLDAAGGDRPVFARDQRQRPAAQHAALAVDVVDGRQDAALDGFGRAAVGQPELPIQRQHHRFPCRLAIPPAGSGGRRRPKRKRDGKQNQKRLQKAKGCDDH